ncbi:hypothetical protein AVEN_13037-1 [Araneus ventricosus]|uniref:Uncharacterized protein n=1 Tax=Araneus ventricosus TaxID=182803 RepID=A0A4Y2ILD1_ARAVE|nr:hypothetical protein AVEN_13037-1 [Araneus ventricosus]
MKGKAYMGFIRADSKTTKRMVQDVPEEERKMGSALNSRKCQESRKRRCDTILRQERKSLFNEFRLTMSWDLKTMFACSTEDIKSTKPKTMKGDKYETENVFAFPRLYTSRPAITCNKWTDLQYLMEFIPSDTHAFYDIILFEEESRRQVASKRKNDEHVSDGRNKKVKIDETDKKKKGVKKDKKSEKEDYNPGKTIFRKIC